MPWLNVRCWLSVRPMSRRSGSGNRAGIAVGGGQQRRHLRRPSANTWPPIVEVLGRDAPGDVDGAVVAEQLLDRGRRRASDRRRRRSHWSWCCRSANSPLPIRFIVVSWPATNSSSTMLRSSSSVRARRRTPPTASSPLTRSSLRLGAALLEQRVEVVDEVHRRDDARCSVVLVDVAVEQSGRVGRPALEQMAVLDRARPSARRSR